MKIKSFTLAEILISLTIIGVIAALTLPALTANLNEKIWNTKRKALHARLAQALASMPRLDGFSTDEEGNTSAFNFIQDGLNKAFAVTKVCKRSDMEKCDYDFPQYTMNDEKLNTTGSAFREHESFNTLNGESIGILAYNTNCSGESEKEFLTLTNVSSTICARFFYDLNGASKGPNKFGKDIGLIMAYFPEQPIVVAPMPTAMSNSEVNWETAENILSENSEYRFPNVEEAIALSIYHKYITSSIDSTINIWTDRKAICKALKCFDPSEVDEEGNTEEYTAYVFLMSKDGNAPKKFKILD